MRDHVFIRLNGKNYVERIKPILAGPLIFASFVIAIGYLGTNSLWTVLAGIVLLAYYINERLRWGRIYITEILEMADDKLRITYMDKNEVKEYTGNKKSFSIERNSVRYRLKADKEQYLLFKDKDKGFTLKQYALGDWEDEKINELMQDWKPESPLALR